MVCIKRLSRGQALAGFALFGIALSSCVGYTPIPLNTADEWKELELRDTRQVHIERPAAWSPSWIPLATEVDLGDGLGLAEAGSLALFYSPAIRIARAEARVAGALVLQAGVLANPQLWVGPRITTEGSDLIFPAQLSWELPIWGKVGAREALAAAELDEKRLTVLDVELRTLVDVRRHFLRLGRLQQEIAILERVTRSTQQIVTWVESLQRAGEVDAVQLYLARSENTAAARSLARSRAEHLTARNELLELIGLLPGSKVELVLDGAASSLPKLPDSDRDALERTPALRVAAAHYRAAESKLRLEIAKQYPAVRFGPEFESEAGDVSIGLGLGISLPIFDRNQGAIAAAAEARGRARDEYRAQLLRAAHAEAKAKNELQASSRMLEIHEQGAMRGADEAARALEVRLRTGRLDIVEVLSAQRAIATARSRKLELEERVNMARVRAAVAGGLALGAPGDDQHKENQ